MEEYIASHKSEAAVFFKACDIVLKYFRIKSVAQKLLFVSLKSQLILQLISDCIKVLVRKQRARSYGHRGFAAKHKLLQSLRESSLRLTHHSLKVGYYRVREVYVSSLIVDIFRRKSVLNHKYSHISNHL